MVMMRMSSLFYKVINVNNEQNERDDKKLSISYMYHQDTDRVGAYCGTSMNDYEKYRVL